MQVTPKKIEIPRREDKQLKYNIKNDIQTRKDKERLRKILLFVLTLNMFFIFAFCHFLGIPKLVLLILQEKWSEIEPFYWLGLFFFVLILIGTIKTWFNILQLKDDIFEKFFKNCHTSTKAHKNKAAEIAAKEIKRLNISVNCAIIIAVILLTTVNLETAVFVLIFLASIRKIIVRQLKRYLKIKDGKNS